jgi:UDP-N-acetylglucosamine diphosphorylase/glucosamine-1-phosphate N-acetyltransferase
MRSHPNIAAVILAAGLGTRMKSGKAKVLHAVCGKPMIAHVLETAKKASVDEIIVVVGHQAEMVKAACPADGRVKFALQERQLGTGHAVLCALPRISGSVEQVVILCGDVPLLRSVMVDALLADHLQARRTLSVLAVETDAPAGYGRVLVDNGRNLAKIVEEKDASREEKRIKTINTGIYCVKWDFLQDSLQKITPDNAQKEFYLTDIIEIGYREGKKMGVLVSGAREDVLGVNTLRELQDVEKIMEKRLSHFQN